MECGLCWENFQATDEVFNCQKMHVFHVTCYEDRAVDNEEAEDEISAMRNFCPICSSQMNITVDHGDAKSLDTRYSLNNRNV